MSGHKPFRFLRRKGPNYDQLLEQERIKLDAELAEAMAESYCPACGSPIDYCQGHGEIGDPINHAILTAHDKGDHYMCDPRGCDDA